MATKYSVTSFEFKEIHRAKPDIAKAHKAHKVYRDPM